MIEKPYGKFTLEQLKQLKDLLHESKNLAQELETVIRDPEKKMAILGKNFFWYEFYELPFIQHMLMSVLILDWVNEIKLAAQSDDPQQFMFDHILNPDPDQEWHGGYNGKFEKKHLVALGVSIFRTMRSIMVYQKSLSTLIEEVRQGNDKSLFDAVRIDRTMVACPSIVHRISMAELEGDNKFFLHLKSALKGTSRKHMVALDEMRYMMMVLVDTGADRLNAENIEQVFVEHLRLYPQTSGAQKNLYKHYTATKKINHRK